MNSVLVLDANQRSALAITRSLGRRGVNVITADTVAPTLAGRSKHSVCAEIYPEQQDAPRFISCIQAIIYKHKIDILIPVTEISLYTVLEHRDAFSNVRIPFDSYENINLLSDKSALVSICQELNLAVPRSIDCAPNEKGAVDVHQLAYPIVLKPYKSKIYNEGTWVSTSVAYAHNKQEFLALVNGKPAFRHHKFLIQEYIAGEGAGVFLLYDKGQCVAQFSHRRLKEKPPTGGVSVLSESVPMDQEMLSISRKLLDHVNWHGVAMVEFKVTPEGKPYVIEINTRFWGSLQLAIDAGVDFPYLLYLLETQNSSSMPPQKNYTTGIRLRWLLGDFDRLYLVLKSDSYSRRQKLGELFSFFRLFSPGLRYEVNRFSDISPFLYELRAYIRDVFKS